MGLTESKSQANAKPEGAALAPSGYFPRIADAKISRYLRLFGAVEISGTKWCGKTWSALAHANSVLYVDRGSNLDIALADPSYVLAGDVPHVIDEWQRAPQIWDTVRHAVDDAAGKKGLWILTGSSTPIDPSLKGHSGAGRIGRVRMRPMTLQESGDSGGGVSLKALFAGEFSHSQCRSDIGHLADVACRGGWPEEVSNGSADAQVVVREYLDLVFSESAPRLGGDSRMTRRAALSIARNLGQSSTNKTLARDMFALSSDSVPTDSQLREVADHVDVLDRLYVLDAVPGWVPASRSPMRMRTKPKRYFADPSMAVGLLGLNPASLLGDWQTFGLVFENLVMRDLDVYARALEDTGDSPLLYYRDDSGLEVDAIIERADGSWAGIEIKLSQEKVDEAVANLLRMRAKLMKDERSRTPEPSFLAVVTGGGEASYIRPDGVYVIPIRCLGA